MRSPTGPPTHPPTLLGIGSALAAGLSTALLSALTLGHPLHSGSPLAFLCLTLVILAVLFLAALPRCPGEPGPPTHSRAFVWLPWPLAAASLALVVSQLQTYPRLWPILLLPLTGLVLAFLATRTHLRPAPPTPARFRASGSQNFCTATQTAALVSMMLNYLLFRGHSPEPLLGFTALLLFLVAMLAVLVLQTAESALPPWFSSSSKPPMVSSVFVWLAWPVALLSAMPLVLIRPHDLPSLWPFALFPLGALTFAFLCTHAYCQERPRQPEKEATA